MKAITINTPRKKFKIENPFTIGSGIITINTDTIEYFAKNINQIGIITSKSIGLKERKGYDEPVLCQYKAGLYFRNAVGLSNPGIDQWIKEISKIYPLTNDKFLLTSIFAQTPEEFAILAKKLENYTDGIELNLSCPHAKGYGMVIGSDKKLVFDIIKTIKDVSDLPVFAKLSPNIDNIEEIAKECEKAGASGIVAINTVGPKETIEENTKQSILSNKLGGESGSGVKNIAISCIKKIREVTNLPIIGMGGISNADDVRSFQKAGANIFGIGTALVGMDTQEILVFLSLLDEDLDDNTNDCEIVTNTNYIMKYHKFTVSEIQYYNEDSFVLTFNDDLSAYPGQFVFTWIPGFKEKPFSILNDKPLSLFIRIKGKHSKKLGLLRKGDNLMIRGAYGTGFPFTSNHPIILIGGGTGIAPLHFYTNRYDNIYRFYLGAKQEKDLEIIRNQCEKIDCRYCIDDEKKVGKIIDVFNNDIKDIEKKYNQSAYYYICGPEKMTDGILNILKKENIKNRIWVSFEHYMKCGVGLCGSCSTGKGLRSCVDGPVIHIDI